MNVHAKKAEGSNRGGKPAGAGAGIVSLLQRLRRKVRAILVVRGFFLAAGTALIALLAALGADALFAPDAPVLRWGLTLSVFAITLVGTLLFLVRPAMTRVSLEEIARVLEVRHPELKERLSNALDIMRRRENGTTVSGVSEELLADTLRSAEVAAAKIRPAREFVHRNWWHYGIVAAVPVVVCCLLAMIFPDQLGRLMARVFNPTSAKGNVYASRMEITPGDAWVKEGEPLIVVLESQHLGTDRAELVRNPLASGGAPLESTSEAMTLVEQDEETGEARFMIKFPAVSDAFEYQVNSGKGSSEWFRIDVRKWPKLKGMTTTFEYPKYTKLEPETTEFAGEVISAPIGTVVSFDAKFSEPLKDAQLQLPRGEVVPGKIGGGEQSVTWQFVMEPGTEGEWSHRVTNQWEMESKSDPGQVRAIEDQPPSIMLLDPEVDRVVVKSDGKVQLGYEANDDFGLGRCEVQVFRDRGDPLALEAEIDFYDEQRQRSGRGTYGLDLAPISSEGAKRLVVFMRVWDTRPDEFGGTQRADSRPIVIDLDHTDGPLRDPLEDSKARKLLDRVLRELRMARTSAEKMRRGLRQGDAWVANEKTLAVLEAQIAKAEATMEELAKEFENMDDPSSAGVARAINEDDVRPAARAAAAIPPQPQNRERNADWVVRNLDEAIKKIEGVTIPFEGMPQFMSPLAQLVSLVDLQKQLAALAALQAMEDPGKPMDEEWLRKQQELAHAMKMALSQKQGGPP